MQIKPFALTFLFASVARATLPSTPAGWTLTWSDDFTGTGQPSKDKWLYDIGHSYPGGADNWGTGEIGYHTDSANNVYLDGTGNLVLKAIRDGSGAWTTARIETQVKNFAPPAGGIMAVEGRLKLPKVANPQGYWPAFWMLGESFRGNYNNWPDCGEIDIMESVNGVNTEYGTLHCDVNPGGECNETNGRGGNIANSSPSLQDDFHVCKLLCPLSSLALIFL
ncbi:Laminin subunit alpha-1 [Rhizophlyctis rosea]|nr:Laminin subunit alpha-1 [Rhizophlyctis rosea]